MSNLIEIWKPCYNYENYFEVSNLGGVRNIYSGKLLKHSVCKKGYCNIRLFVSKDNFRSHKVHRLVMNTFSEIKDMPQVNHINGIKSDNRLENLEWSDNSHNIKHAWANKLFQPKFKLGVSSSKAKCFVHKEYGIFNNINDLANEYQINRANVRKNKIIKLKYIEV